VLFLHLVHIFLLLYVTKYNHFVSQRQGGQGVQQPAGFNTGRLFRLCRFELSFWKLNARLLSWHLCQNVICETVYCAASFLVSLCVAMTAK